MCACGVIGVVGGALGELERRLEQLGRRPLVDRDHPRGVVELLRADAGQARRAAPRGAPRTRPGAAARCPRRRSRAPRPPRWRPPPRAIRFRSGGSAARATRAPRRRFRRPRSRPRARPRRRTARARAARSTPITPNSARRGTRHHAGSASAKRSSSQSSAASRPHKIPDTPTTGSGLHALAAIAPSPAAAITQTVATRAERALDERPDREQPEQIQDQVQRVRVEQIAR